MSEQVSRVANGSIAQISQKVNHFTLNIKFSPLLLSSIISQFSKKVKQSAPTTRKGRERRSREHLYDGRARVRFAPQAQPHDTYIRGVFLIFFLKYTIIEIRCILKMKYHHPPLHRPCGPVKPSRLRGGREIFLKGRYIFDLFSKICYNKNEKYILKMKLEGRVD